MDSAFWRQKAALFTQIRADTIRLRFVPFSASYRPDGWGLNGFLAFQNLQVGRWILGVSAPEVVEPFKSLAAVCAVALGSAHRDDAWIEWLDHLRRNSPAYVADRVTLGRRHTEQRPEPNAEITAEGLIRPVDEIRPDADPEQLNTRIGKIDDVCAASASLCQRIADESEQLELDAANQIRSAPPIAVAKTASCSIGGSPLGEPLTERSVEGREVMSVKDAAKLLDVAPVTIRRLIAKQQLPSLKVGRQVRIPIDALRRLRRNKG